MCGITGYICHKSMTSEERQKIIWGMTDSLSHRGPDFKDTWVSTDKNIALGHSRLSILDLSKNGNQPMFSDKKNFIISFNGEIYNHLELRKKYFSATNHIKWKGYSDSETLINLIENIGLEETLSQVNGMFAFGIFDLKKNKLMICRDKLGEKPLYYGIKNSFFAFGSELKIFKKLNNFFKLELRLDSLDDYFKYGNVPNSKSIFKNIYKLEPGSYLEINYDDLSLDSLDYDDVKKVAKLKKWYNFVYSPEKRVFDKGINYISKLKDLLEKSVQKQTISDVPIGSFLSGGIDSSLISSILQRQSSSKIDTFTIGFSEKKYDESFYAKKIAKEIGAKNHTIFMSKNSLETIFEKIVQIYDEPFSDSSQIPSVLLSEFTKNKVSVIMSGDGGDELFGGYYRHFYSKNIYNLNKYTPHYFRKILINSLKKIPKKFYDNLESMKILPIDDINTKILKLERLLLFSNSHREYYKNLLTDKSYKKNLFSKEFINNNMSDNYKFDKQYSSINNEIMFWDIHEYLPNDILHKVDRATMSTGLEARLPMLDNDVINFSQTIPQNLLISKFGGKSILKKLLSQYISSNLVYRPKKGFSIPIYEWLKGPLHNWAEHGINDLIKNDESELFNHNHLKQILIDNKKGKDNSSILWSLLIFNQWKKSYL